jgi:hypothetical protein
MRAQIVRGRGALPYTSWAELSALLELVIAAASTAATASGVASAGGIKLWDRPPTAAYQGRS